MAKRKTARRIKPAAQQNIEPLPLDPTPRDYFARNNALERAIEFTRHHGTEPTPDYVASTAETFLAFLMGKAPTAADIPPPPKPDECANRNLAVVAP